VQSFPNDNENYRREASQMLTTNQIYGNGTYSTQSFPNNAQPNQGGYYETTPGHYETTIDYQTQPYVPPANDTSMQSVEDSRAMIGQTTGSYNTQTQYVEQAATGHYETVSRPVTTGGYYTEVWVEGSPQTAPTGGYDPYAGASETGGYYEAGGAQATGHYESQYVPESTSYVDEQVWVQDTAAQTVPVQSTTYVPGSSTYIPGTPGGIVPQGALATGPGGYVPGVSNGSMPGMPAGFGTSGPLLPSDQFSQHQAIWGGFAGTPAGDIAAGVFAQMGSGTSSQSMFGGGQMGIPSTGGIQSFPDNRLYPGVGGAARPRASSRAPSTSTPRSSASTRGCYMR
jgi:hypothetical protein